MLEDDEDIVRALGYVTLYSSYLEEQIEMLVVMLEPVEKYSKGWQISDKILHAKRAIRKLEAPEFDGLVEDLSTCGELFLERNELIHGRIYSGMGRPDTLKSSRTGVSAREVSSGDLYQLANELWAFRLSICRPITLPMAVA